VLSGFALIPKAVTHPSLAHLEPYTYILHGRLFSTDDQNAMLLECSPQRELVWGGARSNYILRNLNRPVLPLTGESLELDFVSTIPTVRFPFFGEPRLPCSIPTSQAPAGAKLLAFAPDVPHGLSSVAGHAILP